MATTICRLKHGANYNLLTLKALRRELSKIKEALDTASSSVEFVIARSECLRKQELRDLEQKHGLKTAWVYIIAPYKYTKLRKNTKRQASRIDKYTCALEE